MVRQCDPTADQTTPPTGRTCRAVLSAYDHDVTDRGATEYDAADDPSFRIDVAARAVAGSGSAAVVLAGSGDGERIAASKVPAIAAYGRAAGSDVLGGGARR